MTKESVEQILNLQPFDCSRYREMLEVADFGQFQASFILKIANRLIDRRLFDEIHSFVSVIERQSIVLPAAQSRLLKHIEADAFIEQNRWDDAISVYNHILNLIKDSVAFANRGLAYWEAGRLDDAFRDYQSSLELEPHNIFALRGAGEILVRLDRPSEAIPYLQAALQIKDDYIPALRALGTAYFNMDEFAEAARIFGRVLRSSPGDRVAISAIDKIDSHFGLK